MLPAKEKTKKYKEDCGILTESLARQRKRKRGNRETFLATKNLPRGEWKTARKKEMVSAKSKKISTSREYVWFLQVVA